jgi:hypothetical protein
MSKLQCPNCGASVPSAERWAKAAQTMLMQAPAVPHMATHARSQECQ